MPAYTLHLENHPDSDRYVENFEPPEGLTEGDTIAYDGITWRVLAIALDQHYNGQLFVIRCTPA